MTGREEPVSNPVSPPSLGNVNLPPDDVLRQCIHCGMCLPVCPTYALTRRERSSPRGRIQLIKSVAENALEWQSGVFAEEMFFCLDCRACETACPAGVHYGELVEASRGHLQTLARADGHAGRLQNVVLRSIFTRPKRLKRLARLLRMTQRTGLQAFTFHLGLLKLFAPGLHRLVPMAPRVADRFSDESVPEVLTAEGERRCRVGLVTGCIQNVVYPETNLDTASVLVHNGCEVHVPRAQACCGSLHGHMGDQESARELAKRLIRAFESRGLDAVIINAAGCGSFMKQYDRLLADDPVWKSRGAAFASKVRDIHEFLIDSGFKTPEKPLAKRVTYHEACHLVHGQKISTQPRNILLAIRGIDLVDLHEATWCCGSAGTYNITHTDTALALLDRKLDNVESTGAEIVATANPGCQVQLQYGARRRGLRVEVVHPITLLRRAYGLTDEPNGY